MAAAALLRSIANKMARAPPTMSLARGLHGGARPGLGGFLPPPASSEQAGLLSLANKLARGPLSSPHHRLLHKRGLHSRDSPNSGGSASTPPTTSKDQGAHISEFLRGTITLAKARAVVPYIMLIGTTIYMIGWVKPWMDKLVDRVDALSIERLIYQNQIQAIEHECQHLSVLAEYVFGNVSEAQSMQSSGHDKDPGGAAEKGTRVDKLEEVANVHCREHHVKELQAAIKNLQTEITKLKVALELARSARKV